MKPQRILLIRHGESQGNADPSQHRDIPDFMLQLTPKGLKQARQAGKEIKKLLGNSKVYAYVSPYYRTRETFGEIKKSLASHIDRAIEDPRIREQDWGHLREPVDNKEIIKERFSYSTFYYRIPDGESAADVFDRVSTFLETLFRDFHKKNYPETTLIITHGMTLRVFLMRWFHWSVEEFEAVKNPNNCQIVVLEKNQYGKYTITSGLEKRPPYLP